MDQRLAWTVGIIASAVASTVITVLLNDSLKFLVVRLFGGYASSGLRLRGIWKGQYDYTTEGVAKVEEHYFAVREIGRYVVIRTFSKGSAWYKLRGKRDDRNFLTGAWEEMTPDGRFYHGAFQLTLHPQGNQMTGKWVGFNRNYVIMSGTWTFQRKKFKVGRKEMAEYADHQSWPQQAEAKPLQEAV